MVESDHSESENNLVHQQSEDNTVISSISKKRSRDESFDVEREVPNKKACTEETFDDNEESSLNPQENGITKDVDKSNNEMNKKDAKVHLINDNKDPQNTFTETHATKNSKKDNKFGIKDKIEVTKSTNNEGQAIDYIRENKNTDIVKNIAENDKEDTKNVERDVQNSVQTTKPMDTEFSNKNLNKSKCESEDEEYESQKKKRDSEIINGVELTVECASDEESSGQSEKEESTKPRSKTIIVREKPNDSEVDASSDAENSDSCNITKKLEINVNTRPSTTAKQIKKRDKKKTLSKEDSVSENSSQSNSDDEDYSPIAKKKSKKSPSQKKSPAKPTEAKRGRGRPRGRPPKTLKKIEKALSDDKIEEKKETAEPKDYVNSERKTDKSIVDSENKTETKNEDSISEVSSNGKSDKESNDSNSNQNGNKQKSNKLDVKKIENLKKFIRAAGIKVQCYKTLFKDCKTDADKVTCLSQYLKELGVLGRPTIEKCRKVKIKNETKQEVKQLDTSNIISETRVTRGRRTQKSQIEPEVPSSPVQKARATQKRIKSVVDSDSE